GMGGVFNPVNLNIYHYSFNNPIVYKDPTGTSGQKEQEYSSILETIKSIPSLLVGSLEKTGITSILMTALMDIDVITAGVLAQAGHFQQVKALLALLDTESGKSEMSSGAFKWNMKIAEWKYAEGEFLESIGVGIYNKEDSEYFSSAFERFSKATEELKSFLYSEKENPYYEEGKRYKGEDLTYKELPD
ncbi:MAG: hypothetical protein KAU17_15570, partial [Spirochaetales bacterium]|nr:hypothetical protein [Spirochaetales bacterium]